MRGFHLVLASVALSGGLACSSDSQQVKCGDGTMLVGDTCVAAPPSLVPAFDGVKGVAPASTTSLLVTWADAHGATTPPERMTYAVFVTPAGGAIDYAKPTATTTVGATSFYATALDPSTTYSVAVRAMDEAGRTDANVVVKTGKPGADAAPPAFGGVKTATVATSGTVTLVWDAATDDLTPPEAIVYYVYAAPSSASIDLTTPTLVTKPGVTTVDVTHLYDTRSNYNFVVRARDAADNVDANSTTASSPPGADTTAPRFAGCTSAYADSAGSAIVTWEPADDDATPPALLAYDVFTAPSDGVFDFATPTTTATGAASTRVTGLRSNTVWRFVCRARDFVGNRDANLVEHVAKTLADDTAPTFGGITGATVDGTARTVMFSWAPASDDRTPPEQIVYDVYESKTPGGQSFSAPPRASSLPGALTLLVSDLTPDTTLYWVVRARDLGGNHDTNTVEQSGAIAVSFERQVQPILTHDCAVTGCHVPGNPMAGLILAEGFAFGALVDRPATELPSSKRVAPGDSSTSFFYLKISKNPPPVGWQMPAPATGSVLTDAEKDVVRRWIDLGAPNN